MKKIIFIALLLLATALPARSLELGDKAPEISPDVWVTGTAADPSKSDDKTIYLVEVWSVTCPPCVQTIPLLNDLQKKYADKGFKIVSFTADKKEEVESFLKEHPMEYSSFIDKDGATTVKYMAADNRNTIPHAFLFDKSGAMVWTGNPLDNLEQRLKQVLDGTLTRDKALAIRDARKDLQASFESQDIDGMLESLKKLEGIEPDNGQYYQVHYRILTELGAGEDKDIKDLMSAWYKGCYDQPEALAVLSVLAMDQGPPSGRNPELGLAAAKRAYDIDSPAKLEAGLNLAETYKNIGRLDLAVGLVKDLLKGAAPDRIDMLTSIENYYNRLIDLGKNPTAEFKP